MLQLPSLTTLYLLFPNDPVANNIIPEHYTSEFKATFNDR